MPVKHYRLAEALAEIAHVAVGADVLLLTQNWHGIGEARGLPPGARCVWGDAKAGGAYDGGKLVCALRAIDLGPAEGAPDDATRRVARVSSSARIPTRQHADMLHYLWVQYAVTGAMWAALIDAGSFRALARGRTGDTLLRAVQECLTVAGRRGVELSRYHESGLLAKRSWLRWRFEMAVAALVFQFDAYTRRCSAHAFGDPQEVAVFYNDLMRSGAAWAVDMPAMASYRESIGRFAAGRGGGDQGSPAAALPAATP